VSPSVEILGPTTPVFKPDWRLWVHQTDKHLLYLFWFITSGESGRSRVRTLL